MKKVKIAFIGVGNMASAIIGGVAEDGISHSDVILFDRHPVKTAPFKTQGYTVASSAVNAAEQADIIVLATQPQSFPELLSELGTAQLDGKCFVSIAAGIKTETVCSGLGKEVPVIRVMPNAPLRIGKGATAVTRNSSVSESDFRLICRIFSRMGEIIILPEDKMNEIISVTGSSPAYVYLFIKSIIDAAREQGIEADEHQLRNIVCRTVIGSAKLMMHSDLTAEQLLDAVQTPGGTTEPAVQTLIKRGMPEIIAEAMRACTDRAYELGK